MKSLQTYFGGCGGKAFAAFLADGFACTPAGFSIASCVDFESAPDGITPGLPSPAQPEITSNIMALKQAKKLRRFNSRLLKNTLGNHLNRTDGVKLSKPIVRVNRVEEEILKILLRAESESRKGFDFHHAVWSVLCSDRQASLG